MFMMWLGVLGSSKLRTRDNTGISCLQEGTNVTCAEGLEESNVALSEGSVVGPTEVQHQGHPDDGDIVPAGEPSG